MEPDFPFFYGPGADPAPGHFALLLVERGVLQVQWGSSRKTLAPGTLLLVPPSAGARVALGPDAAAARCSFARSLVDPLAMGAAAALVGMLASPAPLAARLPPALFADARSMFAVMEKESETRGPGFDAMVRLKLMEALLVLSRVLDPSSVIAPRGQSLHRPDDVMRYVQEHYADPLSLAEIAARFGHNPSYFSRLFHRQAGMTLVEYINRARIQKSCQLLKRSDAGITEIAFAVGYNNISHFNRFFRRIMGMSPREYRLHSRK